MTTYFGKTARLVERAGTVSHFQRAVLRIGNFLIFCTVGLVALILAVALYRGDPLVETVLFALILTVAAIPVALPAVLSVTMAVGAEQRLNTRASASRSQHASTSWLRIEPSVARTSNRKSLRVAWQSKSCM